VAELVPTFVQHVVTEFESSELIDFMTFLALLMHRLKVSRHLDAGRAQLTRQKNTFETMDMLLLPLLSRIFAVLQTPAAGTDEALVRRKLQEGFLAFFTALLNANLEGVFITERNKREFENVLTSLLAMANDCSDPPCQRQAFAFFAKSVIAWGTASNAAEQPSVFADSAMSNLSKAVANGTAQPTNQHEVGKMQRAAQALPGYEHFVYQRLVPACFEVPAQAKFNMKSPMSGQVGSPPCFLH
jgi:exportin-T